jgi:hypothetical protein
VPDVGEGVGAAARACNGEAGNGAQLVEEPVALGLVGGGGLGEPPRVAGHPVAEGVLAVPASAEGGHGHDPFDGIDDGGGAGDALNNPLIDSVLDGPRRVTVRSAIPGSEPRWV